MRRALLLIIVAAMLMPACSKHSNGTSTVAKPKTYKRWFIPKKKWYQIKKDKRKKRTRVVKMRN